MKLLPPHTHCGITDPGSQSPSVVPSASVMQELGFCSVAVLIQWSLGEPDTGFG